MSSNPPGKKARGFHKRGTKAVQIPGTKPSIHNNTLLVSSGVPSLDALIGGGIAVGSCLLIDEDRYSTYSDLVLKYYLAEAVTSKHKIVVASASQSPSQIVQDLPQPITHTPTEEAKNASEADDLSIAWRYRNVPSAAETAYGHYYDVTKVMSRDLIEAADISTFDPHSHNVTPTQHGNTYCRLLQKIKQTVDKNNLSTTRTTPPNNILRIAISSVGSPYWCEDSLSLAKFMFSLRSVLRSSYAVCLVTVPGHILENIGALVRFSDCSIQLISFSDNPAKYSKNPAFKEFHGLVKIHKLPCINSLVCPLPDTMDWVFKLKRKKLTIEKMHLPPDLSETVSRSQEDAIKAKPNSSCGQTKTGANLDF